MDNVIHSPKWQTVVEVSTSVGKFTPESFRTNRLPLLNLPDDIKEALRSGCLIYTNARAIARVKGQQQCQELLNAAISEDLFLYQLKTVSRAFSSPYRRSMRDNLSPSKAVWIKRSPKSRSSKFGITPRKSGTWKSCWLNWRRYGEV